MLRDWKSESVCKDLCKIRSLSSDLTWALNKSYAIAIPQIRVGMVDPNIESDIRLPITSFWAELERRNVF